MPRRRRTALLASRASAVERYAYYLRLLGNRRQTQPPSRRPSAADRRELTEANWDETYNALVAVYEQADCPPRPMGHCSSLRAPLRQIQSGASGTGQLYLNAQRRRGSQQA